ncbi:MAG: alpha-(1-_3)-arabinofuranosyltransferase family protein [Nocardioides sp.]
MEDRRDDARHAGILCWTVYLVLAVFVVTEKWGQTTSDTRLDLTEAPGEFLRGTFSLWSPRVSLGELQNQAYGYLFPQGSFFALLESAQVPGWVAERVWSVLVLVVACEGLRRVARAISLGPWAAAIAGLCYGLNPRHIAELGVRSAEILPGAVLPWALLPIVHAVNGRMRPRNAAVLSAAAFAFSGGVNGTATAAPAALLVVFVVWAWATRRLRWSFVLGWGGLMAAVNIWWAFSLLRLGAYSPPFFDYVEDARTTTETAGFASSLRGASNWVNPVVVGGNRWWPAGYDVSYNWWVVLASGALAALGVVGLLLYRGRFRVPLLVCVALGLTFLSIAHVAPLDSPLSAPIRDLLDGPLAPLRNIAKADPILRVALCLGLAVLVEGLVRTVRTRSNGTRSARLSRAGAGVLAGGITLGLVGMSWPMLAAHLRTPGWEQMPEYWSQAADYLDDTETAGAAWVVPGSGFGIQTWGWTLEEPMQVLADSRWVTRSQVPLTPAPTIRMLSAVEDYLGTGAGSPYLRNMLERIGVDKVLVRHDLDPDVSLSTPSTLVALALARSPGIERVATFGELEFGPAIEIFEVQNAFGGSMGERPPFDVRDVDDAVTVASSVEDAIVAVGAGRVGDDQPMVVRGDTEWREPVDIQGDQFRRRERAFGRVHQAESNVMAADDEYRGGRVVPNYPGPPGAEHVVAHYSDIAGVTASGSAGFTDIIGPVRPELAPWSALDGDRQTFWRPAPFAKPADQWIEIDLGAERTLHEVTLVEPRAPLGLQPVEEWRIVAGGEQVDVEADQDTGETVVDLDGIRADTLRIEVLAVGDEDAQVGLAEVLIDGVTPSRTLVVPPNRLADRPDYVFGAVPEARACVTTLLGPDCDLSRQRASEEATGIDRTFVVPHTRIWKAFGLAIARSRPGTLELLRPQPGVQVTGSSWLAEDPTVSPRMVHDRDPATSWIADPRDPEPLLTVELPERRRLHRIDVTPPADIADVPTRAVIEANGEERVVDLEGDGRFEPLEARNFTITFSRPGDDVFTLGIGDLQLRSARLKVPLNGAGRTGAICGFGPPLVVDGIEVPTRVEGRIGAVAAAGQLAVRPCGPRIRLAAGQHRLELRSTEQFQPVALTLAAVGPHPSVSRSRLLRVVDSEDTRHVLDVGPGQEAILSMPQNFNEGWTARVDGDELEPIQVDGWAQGWVLPEDTSGEVVLDFQPQRGYLVTLVAGLVLLGLVLLWAAWLALRHRLTEPVVPESPTPHRGTSRRMAVAGRCLAVLAAYAVGGPIVAGGALLGVLLAKRPRLALAVVTAALLGAVLAFVIQVAQDAVLPADAVDLVTGAAVALGLVAAFLAPNGKREAPAE